MFVGQRQDPFVVNLGETFDLVPMLTDRGLDVGQATATLSAVGLSTIVGRLVARCSRAKPKVVWRSASRSE